MIILNILAGLLQFIEPSNEDKGNLGIEGYEQYRTDIDDYDEDEDDLIEEKKKNPFID